MLCWVNWVVELLFSSPGVVVHHGAFSLRFNPPSSRVDSFNSSKNFQIIGFIHSLASHLQELLLNGKFNIQTLIWAPCFVLHKEIPMAKGLCFSIRLGATLARNQKHVILRDFSFTIHPQICVNDIFLFWFMTIYINLLLNLRDLQNTLTYRLAMFKWELWTKLAMSWGSYNDLESKFRPI